MRPALAGAPAVERKERGRRAGQARRHLRSVGIGREVGERAPAEGEERVRGVAVVAVLADGVFSGLARERVLQLGCDDGDAVNAEDDVYAPRVGLAVAELAGDTEAVGGDARGQRGVERVGSGEVC